MAFSRRERRSVVSAWDSLAPHWARVTMAGLSAAPFTEAGSDAFRVVDAAVAEAAVVEVRYDAGWAAAVVPAPGVPSAAGAATAVPAAAVPAGAGSRSPSVAAVPAET